MAEQGYLIELRIPEQEAPGFTPEAVSAMGIGVTGLDTKFEAIPLPAMPDEVGMLSESSEALELVRCVCDPAEVPELEAQPQVHKVWLDTPIAPFACPIPPCDCDPGTPKGTIADVASFLGTDQVWVEGFNGEGMVVGVVDGGITAVGRTPKPGETAKINNVIGGYPSADWGTTAAAWDDHGNMCATDVLGMAPQCQLFDIRISSASLQGVISHAIAGFQFAINQHRADGTPQVLTNSWGIFEKSWDPVYAVNPNHPFTRKVVEAINEGILVLFAAGNCGDTCADSRCGTDQGPGKSIWGANGHPAVMTVGAVNTKREFIGYSSQGPAALDPHKPDFCSASHFTGYFNSDSGTSAATPIAAGVVALLKQANPTLAQSQGKGAIMDSASDIGAAGWDQHSGAGILQAKAAYDLVVTKKLPQPVPPWPGRYLKYPPLTKGTDVSMWQEKIVDRGWPIVIDGLYGPKSKGACQEFQTQQGLGVDGIVGPITWDATWSVP